MSGSTRTNNKDNKWRLFVPPEDNLRWKLLARENSQTYQSNPQEWRLSISVSISVSIVSMVSIRDACYQFVS